jgi:site-specific DNA recombinase
MKAAIYARYSTELQREDSIEDQLRICRRLINQNGWNQAKTYADKGISGASHLRPSYQKLIQDAQSGQFDVVVAEGLDRLSRDQEHIAAFYKQMQFQGIPIITVAEGEISELHIGLKGTMSSLFLKDLAQKTRRGLEGRIRKGKSAGGITYGYDVVRDLQPGGSVTTGERIINIEQAAIVRRIFEEYASGKSPRTIAFGLNAKSIAGPRHNAWGSSTIYGNWRRGTGILNNELYIGRLIWNRQRFIKDPDTGKRQARMNPEEEWVIEDVQDLTLIDQRLWDAVKQRQSATRNDMIRNGSPHLGGARRHKYLFSGLLKCGCCSGGYTLVSKTYYGCANSRNKGTCDNRLTIKRNNLEEAVLSGLKDQLLHPDLIAEFVTEYQKEYNRLAKDASKGKANMERELSQITRKIDQIITAITEGMYHPSMKDKMTLLEDRKVILETQLAGLDADQPIRLHSGLAETYREQVANLTKALNDESCKVEAANHIRGLLNEIRLVPMGGILSIELVGELAGIMALSNTVPQTTNARSNYATGSSLVMVAGVGFEPTTFRL